MGKGGWLLPVLIVIIIIVAISYFFPAQYTSSVKYGVDKSIEGGKSIVGSVTGQKCPDTQDYVCGSDNKTYQNYCFAQKAKVTYKIGSCTTT